LLMSNFFSVSIQRRFDSLRKKQESVFYLLNAAKKLAALFSGFVVKFFALKFYFSEIIFKVFNSMK
jgi:hypothetical protein